MSLESLKILDYKDFKEIDIPVKLEKGIYLIIGKNNAGKTRYINLIHEFINKGYNNYNDSSFESTFSISHNEKLELISHFQSAYRRGVFLFEKDTQNISDFNEFIEKKLPEMITLKKTKKQCSLKLEGSFSSEIKDTYGEVTLIKTIKFIHNNLNSNSNLRGKEIIHLVADRDISPESDRFTNILNKKGQGATSLIQKYTIESSQDINLIKKDLLSALNKIFNSEQVFEDIIVRRHPRLKDEQGNDLTDIWEIYLEEKNKAHYPLTQIGSGIKTVLLVLLKLLISPLESKTSLENCVFAFEELENNLHPTLFRNLLGYLEDFSTQHKVTFFLTTHSSIALDFFASSQNASITHITTEGTQSIGKTVSLHFNQLDVISDLGNKSSDLLQSNGIIWVEGPSDRIYINRWIELKSNGKIKEGRNYQCAFYGGSLLAQIQVVPREVEDDSFVNLFNINPNAFFVFDSDLSTPESPIKNRVQKICDQINDITHSNFWILEGREIENYIPGSVLSDIFEIPKLPNPEKYESFFPKKSSETSFIEKHSLVKSVNKMRLAQSCVSRLNFDNIQNRFDWNSKMEVLIQTILKWNHLPSDFISQQ